MLRAKNLLAIAGVAIGAAAAGFAAGLLLAPGPGQGLRARLFWRARGPQKRLQRSFVRTLDRLADRAQMELEDARDKSRGWFEPESA